MNWYPSVDQFVHPEVSRAFKYIYDKFYAAEDSIDTLTGVVKNTINPSPAAARSALQSDGTHPLNVANLLGILAQPQNAAVPVSNGSSTSPIIPSGTPTNGQLQIQGGQLFFYNAPTSSWIPIAAQAVIIEDTRANRIANYPPANYPLGSLFLETDSSLIYVIEVVSLNNVWVWTSGTYARTQTQLAALAATLSTNDTGLLANVTNFGHVLQWTGSAWQRGPGDTEHSDSFHEFGAAPSDPGWHACDGTSVSFLKYDGSLGTRALPDLTTSAYAKGTKATYTPTLSAPTAPTLSGSTDPTTIGFTPADAATAGTASINNPAVGTPTSVLVPPFTGGGGGSLVTDPHNHTLTGASITLGGDPIENFSVIKMYRQ